MREAMALPRDERNGRDVYVDETLSLVMKFMIAAKIKGDPRNYVLIVQNKIIDGDGDKEYRMENKDSGEPVALARPKVVHKKHLAIYIGREQAAYFWRCGMRIRRK